MTRSSLESWDDLREYMRDTRSVRGVTQAVMAEALGVAQSTVGNWESALQPGTPDPDSLLRFFRKLGLALTFEEMGGPREKAARELLTLAGRLEDDELADLLDIARSLGSADPLDREIATRVVRGVKVAMSAVRDS